jgi:hypothetical protein
MKGLNRVFRQRGKVGLVGQPNLIMESHTMLYVVLFSIKLKDN